MPDDTRPPEDAPRPAAPTPPEADLARRRFFRQFAGELFQGAATVVVAAQVLQRASAEAAGAILDPTGFGAPADEAPVGPPPAPTGFRTPFREDGDTLYIVDQRRLPDALEEYPAKSAAQAAHAIRDMIVRGAPAIGRRLP